MRLEIFLFLGVLVLVGIVIEVVRRRQLSESYALLWIGVAGVGAAMALGRPLVDRVSHALGIVDGTSLVFALAILFLLVVCINLSMHVSRLEQRVEMLAQEVALRDVRDAEPPHDALDEDLGVPE
ncbi:MAG TPA: DUF2304 domain-containing protein [Acidimicrobiales bacterium]